MKTELDIIQDVVKLMEKHGSQNVILPIESARALLAEIDVLSGQLAAARGLAVMARWQLEDGDPELARDHLGVILRLGLEDDE